jgi:hypothetical protein
MEQGLDLPLLPLDRRQFPGNDVLHARGQVRLDILSSRRARLGWIFSCQGPG